MGGIFIHFDCIGIDANAVIIINAPSASASDTALPIALPQLISRQRLAPQVSRLMAVGCAGRSMLAWASAFLIFAVDFHSALIAFAQSAFTSRVEPVVYERPHRCRHADGIFSYQLRSDGSNRRKPVHRPRNGQCRVACSSPTARSVAYVASSSGRPMLPV